MAIEPIDVTDANGIRVTGSVEVYRDPKGKFFDPNSEFYQKPRYADHVFEIATTRELCTIDRDVLSQALQTALRNALEAFGIQNPNANTIREDIEASISGTRQQCALNADKYVSNEAFSSTDWETGATLGVLTANAYAAIPDPNGGVRIVLASQGTWQPNGTSVLKQFDPDNTHPYDELDISTDANKKVTAAQMKIDGQNATADFSAVGQVLGSALGRALAPNNQFVQIGAGAVVGAIGQKLAQTFAASLLTDASKVSFTSAFSDLGINIAGAGAGSVASFLTAEIGHALGLNGFQEQLFNVTIGTLASGVANKIAADMAHLTFDGAIGAIDWGSAVNGALIRAANNIEPNFAAMLGSYLGQELVPAQTHEGAVGGQLLGAVGSAIGIALGTSLGAVLNFIIPGVGSLIGTIVGTLIGDAIGSHPHPAAVDLIDQAGDHYGYSHSSVAEGGSYDAPDKMAAATVDIINAYLTAVHGIVLDHSKQTMVGYVTDPDFRYVNGWVPSHTYLSFISPYDAVHAAALDVLQHIEVIGGDLLLKRAHANSPSSIPDPGPEWSGLTAASSQSGAEKLVT